MYSYSSISSSSGIVRGSSANSSSMTDVVAVAEVLAALVAVHFKAVE